MWFLFWFGVVLSSDVYYGPQTLTKLGRSRCACHLSQQDLAKSSCTVEGHALLYNLAGQGAPVITSGPLKECGVDAGRLQPAPPGLSKLRGIIGCCLLQPSENWPLEGTPSPCIPPCFLISPCKSLYTRGIPYQGSLPQETKQLNTEALDGRPMDLDTQRVQIPINSNIVHTQAQK